MGTSHRSPLPIVSKLGMFFCTVLTIPHSTFYNSNAHLAITPCVVYKTARAALEAIGWPALRYLIPPSNVNPDCTASVPPRTFQTRNCSNHFRAAPQRFVSQTSPLSLCRAPGHSCRQTACSNESRLFLDECMQRQCAELMQFAEGISVVVTILSKYNKEKVQTSRS